MNSHWIKVKECPICRTPVKALLILNAVKMVETHNARSSTVTFENVDLTEALNGPLNKPASRQSTFSRGSSRFSCNRDLQKRDHVRDVGVDKEDQFLLFRSFHVKASKRMNTKSSSWRTFKLINTL